MKATWKTNEFWASLIGQIMSMVVLFGALNADQGAGIEVALQAIAGGVLSIATIFGFIKATTARKQMAVELATSGSYNAEKGSQIQAASIANTKTLLEQI